VFSHQRIDIVVQTGLLRRRASGTAAEGVAVMAENRRRKRRDNGAVSFAHLGHPRIIGAQWNHTLLHPHGISTDSVVCTESY
jgi:hypothetical protein